MLLSIVYKGNILPRAARLRCARGSRPHRRGRRRVRARRDLASFGLPDLRIVHRRRHRHHRPRKPLVRPRLNHRRRPRRLVGAHRPHGGPGVGGAPGTLAARPSHGRGPARGLHARPARGASHGRVHIPYGNHNGARPCRRLRRGAGGAGGPRSPRLAAHLGGGRCRSIRGVALVDRRHARDRGLGDRRPGARLRGSAGRGVPTGPGGEWRYMVRPRPALLRRCGNLFFVYVHFDRPQGPALRGPGRRGYR